MKNQLFLVSLTACLVIGCENGSDNRSKDFPILYTQNIVTDNSGAVLNATITNVGDYSILECGFVWSIDHSPTVDDFKAELDYMPATGPYTCKITSDLEKDVTYYVRAYIRSSAYLVYANEESFLSKGSSPPEILSFSPASGLDGTEITITGRNFSRLNERNLVRLGDIPCTVVRSDTNEIIITSPQVSNYGDYPIIVSVLGKSDTSESHYTILGPKIVSVYPMEGKPGDLVTIEGEYLIVNGQPCEISFGNSLATVYSIEENKMIVFVPPTGKIDQSDEMVNISVSFGEKHYGYTQGFTMKQSWWKVSLADLPLNDYFYVSCSFSINQYGYVLLDNSLYQYNSINDSWNQKSNFPGNYRSNPFVFIINEKAYIGAGGGNDPYYKQDMWEYDPLTDTWKQLKNLPAIFYTCTGFSIDGKGFVVVGIYNYVWRYNPDDDSWTELNVCPAITTVLFNSFVINTKAYISNYYGDLWEYDSLNDTWMQKDNCPENSWHLLFSNDLKGYAWLYENEVSNIYEYDPETDFWLKLYVIPGYFFPDILFVIDNKGYIGSQGVYNNDEGFFYYFIP
ncbi:MAG: IPT/TIG domain-containing protein [Bacteroidales bacterium]|nr:IPT/TIG domain-containing protein [Bacteroidales bacterium]